MTSRWNQTPKPQVPHRTVGSEASLINPKTAQRSRHCWTPWGTSKHQPDRVRRSPWALLPTLAWAWDEWHRYWLANDGLSWVMTMTCLYAWNWGIEQPTRMMDHSASTINGFLVMITFREASGTTNHREPEQWTSLVIAPEGWKLSLSGENSKQLKPTTSPWTERSQSSGHKGWRINLVGN